MSNKQFLVGNELDLSLLGELPQEFDVDIQMVNGVVAPQPEDETAKLAEFFELQAQLEAAERGAGFRRWFEPGTPYGIDKLHKHREFLFAGKRYHERYASWSNQTGKSTAATYELTLHLTGLYPDWWEGRRFSKPIKAWAAGSSHETTRNIIQQELMGPIGAWGTGMIPADCIVSKMSKTGVSGGIDTLVVKHKSGGNSVLNFKSYDQGRRAFEGEKIDFVWLDEMPPADVYSECYTRTITRNGLIVVTATPLDGMTPLVMAFYAEADILPEGTDVPSVIQFARDDWEKQKEAAKRRGESVFSTGNSKAVIVAGWNDAPWLTEEAKVRILAATPAHLRQARSTGLPGDTGGQVFPIALGDITVDDFPIPAHYRLLNALDPGWNHTGAAFAAVDPDTDTMYIYADYKRGQAEPVVHAEAIKTKAKWADAPVLIDPAGLGRSQIDGKQAFELYRKHGLRLIIANNSVEAGIAEMWERMSTGRLKIFRSCKALLSELATYRRNDRGEIIKENDHICDPVRYLCLGIKHAKIPSTNHISTFGKVKGNVGGVRYF